MEKIGGSVKIRRIAITGAISSGKSTLSDLLAKRGAYVIKADELVHELLSSDPRTIQQVTTIFGDVLTNGVIDRKKLARFVFSDKEKLTALESILHPQVIEKIKSFYEKVSLNHYKAFVVEFPLLFEIGFNSWFDTVVYMTADTPILKNRFTGKGFTEEEFSKRSARFLPEEKKIGLSDIVIHNNGSLKQLEEEATKLL